MGACGVMNEAAAVERRRELDLPVGGAGATQAQALSADAANVRLVGVTVEARHDTWEIVAFPEG